MRTTLLITGAVIALLASALALSLYAGPESLAAPPEEPVFSTKNTYLDAVGPVRAQTVAWELVKQGKMTENGHEYLHEVGEYILAKYGVDGVVYCTPFFDHACYNGFTMHFLTPDQLKAGLTACSKVDSYALGGCMHGAGHAAMAFSKYDVPQALSLCAGLSQIFGAQWINTCSFGVFMENEEPHVNVSRAGNQDWVMRSADNTFPCDDPRIEPQYLPGCWRMQIVYLSNRIPIAESIKICTGLFDDTQKKSCFKSLSDGYVRGPNMNTAEMFSACDLIKDAGWKNACLLDFVERLYLNGYTDKVSKEICAQIDESAKNACTELMQKMQATLSE
jgi:hypothetical protein